MRGLEPRWPVELGCFRAASAGAVTWVGPSLRLTVVVKLSFELVPEGDARLTAPMPLAARDERRGGSPLGSPLRPAELAPWKRGAEVFAAASARSAQAVEAMTVGLALFRKTALFEKRLYVYGDRRSPADRPRPFTRMPIVWERTFGSPTNPVGVDSAASANVVSPSAAAEPASFAPRSTTWPEVRRHLPAGFEDPALRLFGPCPEGTQAPVPLSEDADPEAFFVGPSDQRLASIEAGDWLVLEGLDPGQPYVRCRLPQVAGRARLQTVDGVTELTLSADTLFVETEERRLTLLFRGNTPIREGALAGARLAAWSESSGEGEPAELARFFAAPSTSPTAPGAPRGAPPPSAESQRLEQPPADEDALGDTIPPGPPDAPQGASAAPQASADAPTPAPPEPTETGLRAQILERLRAREPIVDLPLAGADLHGLDLSGAHLTSAKLEGTNLQGAKLDGARLSDAKLRGAILDDASLRQADLTRADLSRAQAHRAVFDEAILRDATMAGLRADGASFRGASCSRATAPRASLERASFEGADLANVDLTGAALGGSRLRGARAPDGTFEDASFAGADLDEVDLSRARLTGCTLDEAGLAGAELRDANLERASLRRAKLAGARLPGANLSRAALDGASFEAADLTGANLQRVTGEQPRFVEATLAKVDVRFARIQGGDFSRANLTGVAGPKTDLSGADLTDANLSQANLRGAKLREAKLVRANLDGADLRDADLDKSDLTDARRATAKLAGATLREATGTS